MDIIDSPQDIQNSLLEWFSANGRHWIPWKLKKDGSIPQLGESISPYEIWIAEVMLQQTKLKVVITYWEKWMQVFPSLTSLAEAELDNVLMVWQGLGYYSRANRIHQSSKILIEFVGKNRDQDPHSWPNGIDQWMSLPGIGRSTAGSIISSAFDLPTPILDGNVKRTLSILLAIERRTIKDHRKLWQLSFFDYKTQSKEFQISFDGLRAVICTTKKTKLFFLPTTKFLCCPRTVRS